MKNKPLSLSSIIILLLSSLLIIGCADKNSAPSIKDNSKHAKQKTVNNYKNISPEKLLIQIKAHYNLDEYSIAKDKLVFLIKNNSDSVIKIELEQLKKKIDLKLAKEQKEKQIQEQFLQNKRLANSLNKMKIVKKGNSTYYIDKNSPEFDTKECFYPYIKVDNYGPKLYFKIRFVDSQPLDIQEYIVNVDKLDHTFKGTVQKTLTRGKKKYNVELLDKEIESEKEIEKLQAVAYGTNVEAIYVGSHDYKKRSISDEQKTSIKTF